MKTINGKIIEVEKTLILSETGGKAFRLDAMVEVEIKDEQGLKYTAHLPLFNLVESEVSNEDKLIDKLQAHIAKAYIDNNNKNINGDFLKLPFSKQVDLLRYDENFRLGMNQGKFIGWQEGVSFCQVFLESEDE